MDDPVLNTDSGAGETIRTWSSISRDPSADDFDLFQFFALL